MQKRMVTILAAAVFVLGTGMAAAQSRGGGGGGMHGGGSWSGGGGWHGGGGSWNGGGGNWNGGGGSWNGGGGSWNGGWHGGSWNNGWHGGSWNNGWHGSSWRGCWNCGWNGGWWGVSFGFPGTWWWPGLAPGWGWGAWGWGPQVVSTPTFVDPGPVTFIQRDQVIDGAYSSASPAPNAPANQFWHYCIDPPGYFPQVQQCNKEWLKVVPNNNSRPAQAPQYQ